MSGITEPSYGECTVSSTRLDNGTVYVSVVGEVDLYTAPVLAEALQGDAPVFVVDLTECQFIDSTALGVLVAARKRVKQLELIAPGLEVRRTFEISGLDRIFPIHKSRASVPAIASGA